MAEVAGLLLAIAGGVDVAVRTCRAITELVHEWKDAPAQIISLDEEIQNSRQIALQLHSFCDQLKAESDIVYIAAISSHLRRAAPYWAKLEKILRLLNESKDRRRKERWMKSKNTVASLQERLRELRLSTLELLSIYTASRASSIESIVSTHHDAQKAWIQSSSRLLSDILSEIKIENLPIKRDDPREVSSPSKERVHDSAPGADAFTWAMVRYADGISGQCSSRCSCGCHTRQQQCQIRLEPFNGIIGSLSVAYFGWQFAGPRCTTPSCQRSRHKLFEVTYSTTSRPKSISIVVSLRLMDGEPSIGISIGRNVRITDEHDYLSTLCFAKTGRDSELKHTLERRPDAVLDVYYMNGFSALHNAAVQGSVDTIKILLAAGADPFLEDKWGIPAVLECYLRLLRGCDSAQEQDDLQEWLPLSAFFDEYNVSHIERIVMGIRPLDLQRELSKPASEEELNAQDSMGFTPLHWAAIKKDVAAVSMLLRAGAHANIPDKRGRTALYEACQSNSEGCARALIAFGGDTNARYKLGYAPIHAAAVGNATRGLLSLLLSARADIEDSQNVWGVTPLSRAIVFDHASCSKHLMDLGADVEKRDSKGDTPLFQAIKVNAYACVRLLLSKNASYLHTCFHKRTVLHKAAMRADGRTFDILAAAHLKCLDPDAKDENSMTARQYFAMRSGISLDTAKRFEAFMDSLMDEKPGTDNRPEPEANDDVDFFDALEYQNEQSAQKK